MSNDLKKSSNELIPVPLACTSVINAVECGSCMGDASTAIIL
jgi:hypothetical protein